MLDIFASTRPTRESKDIIVAPLFGLLRVPPTQQCHWFRAWLAIHSERTGTPTAATARGRRHADALPRTVGLFTRTTTVEQSWHIHTGALLVRPSSDTRDHMLSFGTGVWHPCFTIHNNYLEFTRKFFAVRGENGSFEDEDV